MSRNGSDEMADLEKVIKELDRMTEEARAMDLEWAIGIDDFATLCEALELLKEQPHWIPISEKLPKSMANKVIVYLQHDDYVPQIGYGHYEKFQGEEMWYNLETNEQFIKRGYKVTHWMPMPLSPEGEKLILN